MKPELPDQIKQRFPKEVVGLIMKFVSHLPKEKMPSPNLQRELERLQRSPLRGKNEMYLRGLDDFILQ